MSKFWELLRESVIVQAMITLLLTGGIIYMYVSGKEVPDTLVNLLMVIIGYYFGSKSQQVVARGGK